MKPRLAMILAILALGATVGSHQLKANNQETLPTPCVVVVPSDWGEFKGASLYGLMFEDREGTLRLVEKLPCSMDRRQVGPPRVSAEIRRK